MFQDSLLFIFARFPIIINILCHLQNAFFLWKDGFNSNKGQ